MAMKSTRISVIVPCFNRAKFVAQTLDSVLDQTVSDWECIIIDDGSTDRSAEIVSGYEQRDSRIMLHRQPNQGLSATRNQGISLLDPNSRYVLWLDSDDVLDRRCLEVLADHLDNHPDVGMVFASKSFIDERGDSIPDVWQPIRLRPTRFGVGAVDPEVPDTPFAALFVQDALTTPSVSLFRIDVVRKVGTYDTTLESGEDWDFVLRVALLSRIHFLPEPLLRYRRHGQQLTAAPTRTRSGYDELYRRWARTDGLPPAQTKVVRAANRFRDGRALPYQWTEWANSHRRAGELRAALHCYAIAGRSLGRFALRTMLLSYHRM